ncbi:MAG: stage 0 sporulation family protein [bacterium]
MSSNIIEIKFKGERRAFYENNQQVPFKVGDFAIVEADKGVDLGRVNQITPLLHPDIDKLSLKKVIRKSTQQDLLKYQENQAQELSAFDKCKVKVSKHNLNMKLVDCEYQFDKNKITFYFTSDQRVDFRKLVRDVARVFRTRIEFRQIGVRDEARRLGGFGVCGRKLCCSSWIKEFTPITTQAAKEQNLPLNPTKLAGVCGRLKCCLVFERDFYNQAIEQFPHLAKTIQTEYGEGLISNIDIFNENVIVLYPDDTTEIFPLDYVRDKIQECDNDCVPSVDEIKEAN